MIYITSYTCYSISGSNLSSTVSSRYLERSNEVLDYIDCISNEDVPFEIPVTNSKEKDCVIARENKISLDKRRSFDDGKEKDGITSIKGKVSSNYYWIKNIVKNL